MGRILAVDASLVATGWAVVERSWGHTLPEELLATGCITSKPLPAKERAGRVGADKVERVSQICGQLLAIMEQWSPDLVVGELPAGSQSFSGAVAVGIVYGILGSLRAHLRVPCDFYKPQTCKQAIAGSKDASKQAVQERVVRMWPDVATARGFEHVCDALSAVVKARESDLYAMVARLGAGAQ